MQKTKKPQPLSKSISLFLKQLGIDQKVKEFEAIVRWPEIVGESIADATTAETVTDGILFVKVINSTWRHELIYFKRQILSNIDNKVGYGVIKDIRYI